MTIKTMLLAALISPLAMAADSGGGGGGYGGGSSNGGGLTGLEMGQARRFLEREQYKAARMVLSEVVKADRRNADAWNLLGYSQRKLGNLKRSGKSYERALKLNPDHKGALEYQGQLFVTQNQLDLALENQRRLTKLCPQGCKQLNSLSQAMASANDS